ncbi:MAG TPA: hypothetical protein VJT84_00870 [Gaiellaceae bacterium]|nr:hypothetical protein [Gaiellaceae bacterium]
MDDDWRVTVTLRDEELGRLRRALIEHEVERDVRERLGDRVPVGEGDNALYLYAATREIAREAERVARAVAAEHGVEAAFTVDRWHPVEERWESEAVPLPTTTAERQAEHERREQDEIAESEELGRSLWEVRIDFDSRSDAVAFSERLEAERDSLVPGWTFSVDRWWTYVVIGADTEDRANQVAQKLEGDLPPGATLRVEPSAALAGRTVFAVLAGFAS